LILKIIDRGAVVRFVSIFS